MSIVSKEHPSPLGPLHLVATDAALMGVHFGEHRHAPELEAPSSDRHPVLEQAARELDEYFAGRRRVFTVPLLAHGTPFQERVWQALRRIPYGARCSYGDVARAIGNPKSVRAVGLANGRNPIGIIVPCHRVIGADGSLTGYGGGLAAKEWLLRHEAVRRPAVTPSYPSSPRQLREDLRVELVDGGHRVGLAHEKRRHDEP